MADAALGGGPSGVNPQRLFTNMSRYSSQLSASLLSNAIFQVFFITAAAVVGGLGRAAAVRCLAAAAARCRPTELAQVDSTGMERLRAGHGCVDSELDLSKEAKFTEAVACKVYYGPVYFRRKLERYIRLIQQCCCQALVAGGLLRPQGEWFRLVKQTFRGRLFDEPEEVIDCLPWHIA